MKDKIILHEARIMNIKLKNSRTHRFRIDLFIENSKIHI